MKASLKDGNGEIDLGRVDFTNPIGADLPDPFQDSYTEELLVCHDIIDLMAINGGTKVRITFDKAFLKKVLYSHIHCIRKIIQGSNGVAAN